ncbi:hypothetical protein H5410_000148 [Solanum commersonii]|uniref:Uncharacterized protein n=1 Tax=Solanum commersonii TaxID=4109 RepID=A0A9J6AWC5_SOLCO|nr:hypothetical protein H5410_000148 [Solanum commersonii]
MGEKPVSGGVWPTVKPFINGGVSGMLATCVIQPIDMIKVRIQLGQGSAADVTKTMLKNEGFGAFYKYWITYLFGKKSARKLDDAFSTRNMLGLSAGLLRQATYTTARLGSFSCDTCYCGITWWLPKDLLWHLGTTVVLHSHTILIRILTNKAIEANEGKPLPLYQKALCGLTAGAIGATVGSPADLALIRMQADATLPLAQRRNYTNAFHALSRIAADEGVLALWKGAGPTVVRAMALNMGMLASYDQSVEFFRDNLGMGEAATVVGNVIEKVISAVAFNNNGKVKRLSGVLVRSRASSVSGFFAAACSLPFDYVKTQIQKMQPDAEGKLPYTGSFDCAMKTLKAGGPFKFYTGFPVYCIRIAPHVMMTWIFLNQIQKVEKKIGL